MKNGEEPNSFAASLVPISAAWLVFVFLLAGQRFLTFGMSSSKLADAPGSWCTLFATWKDDRLSRFALRDLAVAPLVDKFLSSVVTSVFLLVVFAGLLWEVYSSTPGASGSSGIELTTEASSPMLGTAYTFTDALISRSPICRGKMSGSLCVPITESDVDQEREVWSAVCSATISNYGNTVEG